jgi:two-component system, OmpR family, manganese sensing response regulator
MPTKAKGPTILIIEDNVRSAVAMAELLRDEGYGVLVAHDGAEGLEIATLQHPDLVLLDVALPALDGHEVLSELRRRRIPTRVVVHSAQEKSAEQIMRLIRAGACDHVPKPSRFSVLLAHVKRALAVEPTLALASAGDELLPRISELEGRVARLEGEKAELLQAVAALTDQLRAARARAEWTRPAISIVYLAVSIAGTWLLARFDVLAKDEGLVALPILLFLLMLLPIGRMTKFTARLFRSETKMEMGRD